MNPALTLEPIFQLALVMCRVLSLWMFFPFFGNTQIPMTVRFFGGVALSLSLLGLVSPHLPKWSLSALPDNSSLLYFTVREFIIGAGMGLVVRWAFTAAQASAEWMGMQMGFSAAELFNAETQTQESAWTQFHAMLALLVFIGIGGHWFLLRALVESYQFDFTQMFQHMTDVQRAATFWSEVGQSFFMWMLKLAGPLMVVVFLLQAGLGVLSKFIPQINLWILSIPLTIGVGIFVFTLLSPLYGDALGTLFVATGKSTYGWLNFLGTR